MKTHLLGWTGVCLAVAGLGLACAKAPECESADCVPSTSALTAPALPPPPLLTSQEKALQNEFMSSLIKGAWNWKSHAAPFPVEAQGLLHAGNSTNDLRVQVDNCDQVGVSSAYPDGQAGVCIFTNNPEAVTVPLSASGIMPISEPPPEPNVPSQIGLLGSDFVVNTAADTFLRGSRFICDVNNLSHPADPFTAANRNPYPCDAAGNAPATTLDHDCYDVGLMGISQSKGSRGYQSALSGRRVRLVVANPKTPSAQVARVIFLSAPVEGVQLFSAVNSGFVSTPSVSGDGHLLIVSTPTGIEYSYSTTPCDITGWTNFQPITVMYKDPNVNSTYGIARFPIRDSENNILVPGGGGTGIYGSYLWMDTRATMLFFNGAIGNAAYFLDAASGQVVQRYQVTNSAADGLLACNSRSTATEIKNCFESQTSALFSMLSSEQSMEFFGLWTNGKLVRPDSKLNKNALGVADGTTQNVALYSSGGAWTVNSSDLRRKSAFEKAFNFLPDLRPLAPQDVVWQVSTNEDADEIVFDDYLHTDALIVSPMNASVTELCLPGNHCFGQVNDGFIPSDIFLTGSRVGSHVQNVATSLPPGMAPLLPPGSATFAKWNTPSYGILSDASAPTGAHSGRVEPVTAGGVRGSGLYLNGQNFVRYPIPAQSVEMSTAPWFYSLWVDWRGGAGALISSSDGSSLSVVDSEHLALRNHAGGVANVALPFPMGSGTWIHLGLGISSSGLYSLFVNGFHWTDVSLSGAALVPAPNSDLYLGSGPVGSAGVTAWVDDFKVSSRIPTVEEVCREAYGTLTGVAPTDGVVFSGYANLYPASSHQEIKALVGAGSKYSQFFCEMNVVPTYLSGLLGGTLPQGGATYCIGKVRRPAAQTDPARCVAAKIVFPEGPISIDVARPISRANSFCLSCHVSSHPFLTLTPGVLGPSSAPPSAPPGWVLPSNLLKSQFDPIRRPLEAPEWETGVTPAGLYCSVPLTPGSAVTASIPTDVEVSACGD